MDKLHSDPAPEDRTEAQEPWWGIPRFQIGVMVFAVVYGASCLVLYRPQLTKEQLTFLGCVSGSLLVATLIVFLGERLWGMGSGKADTEEAERD